MYLYSDWGTSAAPGVDQTKPGGWLEECRQAEGVAWPQLLPCILFNYSAGWPKPPRVRLKRAALLHLFISYQVADIQNIPQVAMEAGNSPQMILKHYRELVRPKAAKEWFAITPKAVEAARKQRSAAGGPKPGNVVSLPEVKVAA
jgi:hypothetical protein